MDSHWELVINIMRTFWPNDRTLLSRNPSAAASVSVSISVSISTRLISHECPVFPRHHPLFTFPVAIIETLLVCRLPVTGYIELGHFLRLDFLHVPHSKLCGDGPKLGKKTDELAWIYRHRFMAGFLDFVAFCNWISCGAHIEILMNR